MQHTGLIANVRFLIPHDLIPHHTLVPVVCPIRLFPKKQFCRRAADHFLAFAPGDLCEALVYIQKTLIRKTLNARRKWTFMECFRKAFFRSHQRLIGFRQFGHVQPRLEIQRPFFGERVGQLLHLDIVERLFENEQPVGLTDFGAHFLPRVVRVGRANNDLQFRIYFPDAGDGFDAVPSWRHPDVHKSHRVWLVFHERLLHHLQSFLPLVR